jgi:tRNA (guanine-N7-)-methyltransferase
MLAGVRPSYSHLVRKGRRLDGGGVLLEESLAALGRPIDFVELFGNPRPVEAEIGTGKGAFLLARASARPELNFLGIEWARAYCLYAADRIRRAGLPNVRMLRADAAAVFKSCLPPSSLWRVHVYFPDPWPKRRHHGRRLIQDGFIDDARRALRPGGRIVIVTDHLEYFRHIQAVLERARGLATAPFPRMTDGEELAGTNFERKYIAQGRPFYSVARMRYA